MQLISYKVEQKLPRVKKTRIIPVDYQSITYAYDVETRNMAKALIEHMSIVREARTLIGKGKSVTWEEFKKAHGSKRRK